MAAPPFLIKGKPFKTLSLAEKGKVEQAAKDVLRVAENELVTQWGAVGSLPAKKGVPKLLERDVVSKSITKCYTENKDTIDRAHIVDFLTERLVPTWQDKRRKRNQVPTAEGESFKAIMQDVYLCAAGWLR